MIVSGVGFKVFELAVGRNWAAGERDVFLYTCKSLVAEVERESGAVGSGAGLTTFIYHGVNMRMTAIKAKARRVFRSIYL